MGTVLLFIWVGMGKFTKVRTDVVRHGKLEIILGVVPLEMGATREVGFPVCGYFFIVGIENNL